MKQKCRVTISFFGDSSVGCNQLSYIATYESYYISELAVICWEKKIKEIMVNEKIFQIIFCNGPGQEKYRGQGDRFMKISDILIFVYDITHKQSFLDLKSFIDTANELNPKYKGVILGNKSDLYINEEVKEIEGREFAKSYGFKFLLTSALNRIEEFNDFLNQLILEVLYEKKLIDKEEYKQVTEKKELIKTLKNKKEKERALREMKLYKKMENEIKRGSLFKKLKSLKYYNI